MNASVNRIVVGVALLVASAGVSLPGAAQADTHRFVATMETALPQQALISSDMRWACAGAACAAQGPMFDAPSRICSRFAREQGRIASFTVNGAGFTVEQLERCNARALAQRPTADLSADAR
jgi:hypothetical protein